MRIAVLGAGTMGMVVGTMLTKNGLNVAMVDGYREMLMY